MFYGHEDRIIFKENTDMKILKNIILVSAVFLLAAVSADAQVGKRWYINAGWQFNATPGNGWSETAQGWGGYAEGGYYLMPRVAVGLFASYNTNNDYIGRDTYYFEGGAVNTDMFHSMYQLPFGATFRYRFTWSKFEPYIEAKAGANYSSQYAYFSSMAVYDKNWGFYASPEVGFTWHPFSRSNFGFQFALYYSYATNRSDAFDICGINNCGFKLGLSF